MKILIEHGGYPFLNMGDLAMLQVAINRLSSFCPDASVKVFTTAPDRLNEYCPNIKHLLPHGREIWFYPLIQSAYKLPSSRLVKIYSNLECKFRRYSPDLVRVFINLKLRRYPPEQATKCEEFMKAIYEADLVIASGGGYITDIFKNHASSLLNTIDLAHQLGKPTALLGQGLGPLKDSELLAKTKYVLSSVNLISLREKRSSIPIVKSLNISPDRFIITGDDAIEMAYEARNPKLGDSIGINLRVAGYAEIDSALVETIRAALQDAAKSLSTSLIPVPISLKAHGKELSDSMAIRELLKDYDNNSDSGQYIDTPHKVIHQIGRCRVVVTGSYHAGVFALAQGIPVIGLASSEYYADKFLGLADQFGVGCEVVFLNDQQLKKNITNAIYQAWDHSENLRNKLLEEARKQIDLGKFAYEKLYKIVKNQ